MAPTRSQNIGSEPLLAIASLEQKLDACMKDFGKRLKDVSTGHSIPTTLEQLSTDFQNFLSLMLQAISNLREQITTVASAVDDQENRSRRKFLIFRGIPETVGEKVPDKICSTLLKIMDTVKMNSVDIEFCYRLGRPGDKPEQPPRSILVKFRDYSTRSEIWKTKKVLKGSDISIAEFLTQHRRNLLVEARNAFGVHKCWSQDGNIYIKLPDDSKQRVSSMTQLRELICKYSATAPVQNLAEPKYRSARRLKK